MIFCKYSAQIKTEILKHYKEWLKNTRKIPMVERANFIGT